MGRAAPSLPAAGSPGCRKCSRPDTSSTPRRWARLSVSPLNPGLSGRLPGSYLPDGPLVFRSWFIPRCYFIFNGNIFQQKLWQLFLNLQFRSLNPFIEYSYHEHLPYSGEAPFSSIHRPGEPHSLVPLPISMSLNGINPKGSAHIIGFNE